MGTSVLNRIGVNWSKYGSYAIPAGSPSLPIISPLLYIHLQLHHRRHWDHSIYCHGDEGIRGEDPQFLTPFLAATPETAISGVGTCRAGGQQPSSTPLDTPRRTPLLIRGTKSRFAGIYIPVWYGGMNTVFDVTIGVQRGVSKTSEDGCKLPALRAGHPTKAREAVSGVAHLQDMQGLGMAGPSKTIGSP
jgi:hypothetical protein